MRAVTLSFLCYPALAILTIVVARETPIIIGYILASWLVGVIGGLSTR